MFIMAKKNVLSRKASNFYYDEETDKKSDVLLENNGWIDPVEFIDMNNLKKYSNKLFHLIDIIQKNSNAKHMIYTFFKEKSGVQLMHTLLSLYGITSIIYSGDISAVRRQKILDVFNSKKNVYGEKIQVILVTGAGAEGITLLDTQHVHIFESDKRENYIQQVIGRVVRYKSHERLPPNKRLVNIWRYWSVPNKQGKENNGEEAEGIDEILYKKGKEKIDEIGKVLDLMKTISIT